MGKVDKSFDRQELADYLEDLSRQLRRGTLDAAGHNWLVPVRLTAKIHFKEEDGYLVTKISWQWPAAGAAAPASEPATPTPASFKEIKAGLSTAFKELQRALNAGHPPEARTLQDFVDLSRAFAAQAAPAWREPGRAYLGLVEELREAIASGRHDTQQAVLQALTHSMTACHQEFKK
jgi:XXXCH domain-containing protein